MFKQYISDYQPMKDALEQMGFRRKNRYEYFKMEDDARLSIEFGHSTHNQHHVRYYAMFIFVSYPCEKELQQKIKIILPDFGGNLGNFSPERSFQNWRVAEDDSPEEITNTINAMAKRLHDVALPLFSSMTTIPNITRLLEKKEIPRFALNPHTHLPVYYILLGRQEEALKYAEEHEAQMRKAYEEEFKKYAEEIAYNKNAERPQANNLENYQLFTHRIRYYIKNGCAEEGVEPWIIP